MTVLSKPRHPLIDDALTLAGQWCAGHLIDGAPALGHAVKVALVLNRHLPDPAPELVAAVLLHDAPYFAPPTVDLDAVLTYRFGPATTRTVRQLEAEHAALDQRRDPDVTGVDRSTLWASAADKIVSLGSILRRAARAADPATYWHTRHAFVSRVPYFVAFHTAATPHLPAPMAAELRHLTARADHATTEIRRRLRLPGSASRVAGPDHGPPPRITRAHTTAVTETAVATGPTRRTMSYATIPGFPRSVSRPIVGDERVAWTEDCLRRYARGESIRAIAGDLGRSYGFVHKILTEGGAQLRTPGGPRVRRANRAGEHET